MGGYVQDKILDEQDLKEIRDLIKELKWYRCYQYYNLFDMDRADVEDPSSYGFFNKLHSYSKMDYYVGCYFLKYIPGSFCRMHSDHGSDLTMVTLIDDENLVGGHSIVREIYGRKERPSDQECKRSDADWENPPYDKPIIFDVLPFEVGDSLIYGPSLHHAVSKVYEGSRTVLICWFSKTKRDEK